MTRNAYRGPKLPRSLLDQVQDGHISKRGAANGSRKARRQAERQQKKAVRKNGRSSIQDARRRQSKREEDYSDSDEDIEDREPLPTRHRAANKPEIEAKPLKSILKKPAQSPESESGSDDLNEPAAPVLSKAVKSKLRDDNEEIAALEKKLGIKSKKSRALESDGLDWIAEGSPRKGKGKGKGKETPNASDDEDEQEVFRDGGQLHVAH